MRQLLLSLLTVVTLSACGGGGGGGPSLPMSADGYPDVNGKYLITYAETPYTCSNKFTGKLPLQTYTSAITRSGGVLNFSDELVSAPDPKMTIISAKNNGCSIRRDGGFECSGGLVFAYSGINGANTANYTVSGEFTGTGFSATDNLTHSFSSGSVICHAAIPVTAERY